MMSISEWECPYCRYRNGVLYFNNSNQSPTSKCRCCGSEREATASLRTDRHDEENRCVNLDQRIVDEWNDLTQDIDANPQENECDGGLIIDSCPMIQKLFFVMKYYQIFKGKQVVGMEDGAEYSIDSMTDLVEGLRDLSLIVLVDIFEHVSTVHRDQSTFRHFTEGIGHCDDGAACDSLRRHSRRTVMTQSRAQRANDTKNAVEEHTLSFLDKWHSFLFHSKSEITLSTPDSMDERMIGKMNSISQSRETSKYVDYRFGVWIDYTVNSPFFKSMRDEMTGNEICKMTQNQWQSTLMKAVTHLDSGKIKAKRYTAKQTEPKYGVTQIGQVMGIENVMAILIYCNFTDLQRHFTETFWRISNVETEEMIIERHCRNYYWLGRYNFYYCQSSGQIVASMSFQGIVRRDSFLWRSYDPERGGLARSFTENDV